MDNNKELVLDPYTGLYFYVDLNEIQQCIDSINKTLNICNKVLIEYELSIPFLTAYYNMFGKRKPLIERI